MLRPDESAFLLRVDAQLPVGLTSVVTVKPAICGHFKTGHRDWPKT